MENIIRSHFNFKRNLDFSIQKNGTTILTVILLIVVGSGMFYNNLYPAINNSKLEWYSYHPSDDFNTSIYIRTNQMLEGKEMKIEGYDSASGQLMPILFAPFLSNMKLELNISYLYFLTTVIFLFITFFILLNQKSDKTVLNTSLIFLIAFIISEPGLLGIRQGNTDIFLAPIIGILLLIQINLFKKKNGNIGRIIISGTLAGAMMNAKIFLLPIAIVVIIFSKRILLSIAVTFTIFISLVYFPNFFNSPSSLSLFINKIINWNVSVPLTHSLWANHSPFAIATYFSGCMNLGTCNSDLTNNVIAITIIAFTFIMPFLLSITFRNILKKNLINYFLSNWRSKEIFLILIVLSVAVANMFIKIAYDYRLYFSFIITLIIFKESAKSKKALTYCYFSMFSLLLGGTWFMQVFPNQFWTIDSRLMGIFIIFHFFFLIRASIALWEEIQKERVVQKI